MYYSWKEDPSSVHASWRSVFSRMDAGALPGQSFVPPPSLNAGQSLASSAVPAGAVGLSAAAQSDVTKVMQLINAYQARGHNVADLDPLGMYDADLDGTIPPDLELANYGFTEVRSRAGRAWLAAAQKERAATRRSPASEWLATAQEKKRTHAPTHG